MTMKHDCTAICYSSRQHFDIDVLWSRRHAGIHHHGHSAGACHSQRHLGAHVQQPRAILAGFPDIIAQPQAHPERGIQGCWPAG